MKLKSLTRSPFLTAGTPPAVYFHSKEGPYNNTLKALSNIDISRARGKKILLKPNIGRIAGPESGIVTNHEVIAAAIDAFINIGAEVAIGESPITGINTMEAFRASGVEKIAQEKGVKLIDLNAKSPVEVKVPDGKAIKCLKICREIFEYDLVVSIPVMKTHMHTGVTLSVKNMKGCLWRRSKVDLHMLPPVEGSSEKSLDIAIADMSSILMPHLSIIDGTIGMEGLGPSAGEAKPMDIAIVSADPYAADSAACRIMGIRAEDVPHLAIGASRGYGIIDLNRIDIKTPGWEKLVSPFAPPPDDLSVEFSNIKVLDENSCSACQSTLLLFLKRYGDKIFDYFPGDDEINIAIGKGHEDLPINTLCIGNCTAGFRKGRIFVPGCPPVSSAIMKSIEDEGKKKK